MKLALLIDANPRTLRGPSFKSRLREGIWKIKLEGVVDSNIVIFHSLQVTGVVKSYDKHAITDELRLKGPSHVFLEVLNAGSEKGISAFAISEP